MKINILLWHSSTGVFLPKIVFKNIFRLFPVINRPGFNDAKYNWETFESNTFFSLFTTNEADTKYGFDLQLTCQKPIAKQEMYIFQNDIISF